jgi:hypothetical protein
MKLLVTAAANEIALEGIDQKPMMLANKLKVPKSTTAPTTPTMENLRKRLNSRLVFGEKFIPSFSGNPR